MEEGGEFVKYIVSLSQDGHTVQMIQDCPETLKKMTRDLEEGMTIAMSIWESESLDWLQHDSCNTSCGQVMGGT